jgi:carbon monoxide dehydrogenase subunit G
MELAHNFTVAVPVEQAWQVLLDLERIAPCLPGATLTSHSGDEFAGTVRVKLGPVTMTFAGQGRFLEKDEQARRIVIEASGKERKGGGSARATVRSSLRGEGDSTVVDVHTDMVITGRAAQFGRGMIAEVSTRLLGQFTACLADQLGQGQAGAAPPAGTTAGAGTVGSAPAVGSVPAVGSPPAPGSPPAEAEPIDLLGVTGVRAAAGRLVPYLVVFVAGALLGAVLVAWLG